MQKKIANQVSKEEVVKTLNWYQEEFGFEKREELALLIGLTKEALAKWVSRGYISPNGMTKLEKALQDKKEKDESKEYIIDVAQIYKLWMMECGFKDRKALAKFLDVDIKTLKEWEKKEEIPDKFIQKYKMKKFDKYRNDKNLYTDMKAYSIQEIEVYGSFFQKMEYQDEKEMAEDILNKYSIDYENIEDCSFLHSCYDTDINGNHVGGARGIKIKISIPIYEKEESGEVLHVNTISIPKLSVTGSCGEGNNLESIDTFETKGQLIIDADTLKVSNGKLKAIKVEGFSMVPTLLPDSWVIFNEHGEYDGEGLYVLNFRNILMVKLLQINQDGNLRIISTNKDYESYTTEIDDQSVFKLIGKVVRVIM